MLRLRRFSRSDSASVSDARSSSSCAAPASACSALASAVLELGLGGLELLAQRLDLGLRGRGVLARAGELGLYLGEPDGGLLAQGAELGVCGGGPHQGDVGRPLGLRQLHLELFLLRARPGGCLAGGRELIVGRAQVGARLHELGLRAHQLPAQLDQLGSHPLRLVGLHRALDRRALAGRQRLFSAGTALILVRLPEHRR